jgi:hypothetical protein
MEELKTAVFEMAANKAAGPDGFNTILPEKLGIGEARPFWSA